MPVFRVNGSAMVLMKMSLYSPPYPCTTTVCPAELAAVPPPQPASAAGASNETMATNVDVVGIQPTCLPQLRKSTRLAAVAATEARRTQPDRPGDRRVHAPPVCVQRQLDRLCN